MTAQVKLSEEEAFDLLGIVVTIEHGMMVVTFKSGDRELWLPVDGPRERYVGQELWSYKGQLYVPAPERMTA